MARTKRTSNDVVFVLAPFGDPFDEYYTSIVKPSIQTAGFTALRADEIFGARPIIIDIWNSIQAAEIILAEMTGRNANVLYEVGLSHAIGKPVVMITQTMDDVPFDLKSIRCILYSTKRPGWDSDLQTRVRQTLIAVTAETERHQAIPLPRSRTGSVFSDKQRLDELYNSTRFGDLMMITALAEIGGGPILLGTLVLRASQSGVMNSAEFTVHSVSECRKSNLLVTLNSTGRNYEGALTVDDEIYIALTPLGKQVAGLWARPDFFVRNARERTSPSERRRSLPAFG